jgi:hypothetical protein
LSFVTRAPAVAPVVPAFAPAPAVIATALHPRAELERSGSEFLQRGLVLEEDGLTEALRRQLEA